jgi:FO synthase
MESIIRSIGRAPRQRTTLYRDAPNDQVVTSFNAPPVAPIVLTQPSR